MEVADGTVRRRLAIPLRTSRSREIAFSPDGRWLAQAEEDGTIRLWSLEHGGEAGRLPRPRGARCSGPNPFSTSSSPRIAGGC